MNKSICVLCYEKFHWGAHISVRVVKVFFFLLCFLFRRAFSGGGARLEFELTELVASEQTSEMKMRIKRDSPCLVLRFMPLGKLGMAPKMSDLILLLAQTLLKKKNQINSQLVCEILVQHNSRRLFWN